MLRIFNLSINFVAILQRVHTRYALHKRAYQHSVGAAVELMLLEVLLLADPYLLFPGTHGQLRRMSECPGDMAAYWKLSDSVLKQIETSYAPVRFRCLQPSCHKSVYLYCFKYILHFHFKHRTNRFHY